MFLRNVASTYESTRHETQNIIMSQYYHYSRNSANQSHVNKGRRMSCISHLFSGASIIFEANLKFVLFFDFISQFTRYAVFNSVICVILSVIKLQRTEITQTASWVGTKSTVRFRSPATEGTFLFTTASGGPPSVLYDWGRGFLSRGARSRKLTANKCRVKNMWSFTFTTLHAFMTWYRGTVELNLHMNSEFCSRGNKS
jgi:hypothetical protein